MPSNEVAVLIVLAMCSFGANVLHGLTGCGSILVLHALWQAAITLAPDVLDNADLFGKEDIRGIARFSYVLSFFIQIVLTILLVMDERRKRALEVVHGMPPTPSDLNGVLLLAFIPCSFIGALVGVFTMNYVEENGLRIILGASCLFFSLTFLALYQMKSLEKKKTEDVIRDDLMLMRIQSEVQRHVIAQYIDDMKQKRERRERRRHRHRDQRQAAKKDSALPHHHDHHRQRHRGSSSYGGTDGSAGDAPAADPLNSVVPLPGAGVHGGDAAPRSGSSTPRRDFSVHAAPSYRPTAQFVEAVYLPASGASTGGGSEVTRRRHTSGRSSRYWIKEANVHVYIRHRLAELSRNTDSLSDAEAREAFLAAWTLRAMDADSGALPCSPRGLYDETDSGAERGPHSASGSGSGSNSSGSSDSEADTASVATPTTVGTAASEGPRDSVAVDSAAVPEERKAREERSVHISPAVVEVPELSNAEREAQHRRWRELLDTGADGEDSVDLTKSIARAAAAQPRRVIMGHAEVLNIGLREAQQHQLLSMQQLSASEYKHKHPHRVITFEVMDGGVITAAMVSSFFSGLLGTYTGVSDPPLTIFALAMNISTPVLRMNYAVSSIVPAALRAIVGIYDGFMHNSLLVHYIVSVLLGWGGVACGLYLSNSHAVSRLSFMVTTLTTMLLVAFLMLVPIEDVLTRVLATGLAVVIVAAVLFHEQQQPEHRRPPAPPNTPSTAAEAEAFEQYWAQQERRRQRATTVAAGGGGGVCEGKSGSSGAPSPVHSTSKVRFAASTAVTILPDAAGTPRTESYSTTSTQPHVRLRHRCEVAEAEDARLRSRGTGAGEASEEELITVVPVHASSHV